MKDDFVHITMKIRNQNVTGSETRLNVKNGKSNNFLIDNGAFQDNENEEFTKEDYSMIDSVHLTHAHIDHSGGLAEMMKSKTIPVYGTAPTIALVPPMINDMYNVMKMRGRNITKDDELALKVLSNNLREAKLYSKITSGNCEFTYLDNGHILGASMIMMHAKDPYRGINLLFSGDYREEHPFIRTFGISQYLKTNPIDLLVMECTYGDRDAHISFSESIEMLEKILEEGLAKGSVLLGSFSVDRTPVLLQMINLIQLYNPKIAAAPVYLDGKLAVEALEIYHTHESKFKCPWADIIPQRFHIIEDKIDRLTVQNDPTPKIIVATSGQYHGGAIVSWVPRMLTDEKATLVQSGFISHPMGKQIFAAQKGDIIQYYGQELEVKADLKVLSGASAHVDNPGILKFILKCRKVNPKMKIVLTHGNTEAKEGCKRYLIKNGIPAEDIYIQGPNQHFEINKHTLSSGKILVDD